MRRQDESGVGKKQSAVRRSQSTIERDSTNSGLEISSFVLLLLFFAITPAFGQIESIPAAGPPQYRWTGSGRFEGHLPLHHSPEGAFSPDGSELAIVSGEKVALFNLRNSSIEKVLHCHLEDVTDLDLQSADFISPTRLFLLGSGLFGSKKKHIPASSVARCFQWNIRDDALFGEPLSTGSGYKVIYLPMFGWLCRYKQTRFLLWNPNSNHYLETVVPDLTNDPSVYQFSPDGHWLLLAQIPGGSPNPIVVKLREHKFSDVLSGHEGTVLSIMFSRDSRRVATACADGKVRVFSVPDWKPLQTLGGHQGPVHWAEFSPDGNMVVSAGEDQTVRVWSAEEGKLQQTLTEAQEPVLTVSFSPDGTHLAATTEKTVHVWARTPP